MKMLEFKKFIFSNKNMLGIGLASLAIVLALAGVLKNYWMVVVVLSYIFGYIVGPVEKEIKFYHIKGENVNDYIGFVNKLQTKVAESNKMPNEAKTVMNKIFTTANEMLQFMKDNDSVDEFSEDFRNFKSIFDNYLPKLINQYEKLPINYATTVKTSQGKTAKDMLVEQLSVINQKMTEIAYAMYENDLTALKVNGRFLKQRFEGGNFFEMEKNA